MLQQQANHVNPPVPSPMGSLVIGDSIIKNIDQDKLIDTKVISMGGACVDDIKRKCLQMKDKFKDITTVGTNNCDGTQDAESTISDFRQLLQAGHDRAQKVTVSSICPRTDISDIQDRVDTVDAELFTLCTEMNCTFVNNDNNFKTADGSANDCYLTADGLHLPRYGTNRLARNLKLHMKGQDATKDDRSHQTQDRAQNQQQKQRRSTQR